MAQWYIHINQAVRKYNKTRQTFYNYINKWFVKTKKVNNKVYLFIEDIEKILNDYIPDDHDIIEPWKEKVLENSYATSESSTQTSSDEVLSQTQERFKNLNTSLTNSLSTFEHSILNNTKENMSTNFSSIKRSLEARDSTIYSSLTWINAQQRKIQKKQSKILFFMYYLVFVSINVFILWYIS